MTVPVMRTASFSNTEYSKEMCMLTRKLHSCPANTTPSTLLAKATNLFIVGTTTEIQWHVSSLSLYLFALCSIFLPGLTWHVITCCNSIAFFLGRSQGQLTCRIASQRTNAADQYLHCQKCVLHFPIMGLYPFSLFIIISL